MSFSALSENLTAPTLPELAEAARTENAPHPRDVVWGSAVVPVQLHLRCSCTDSCTRYLVADYQDSCPTATDCIDFLADYWIAYFGVPQLVLTDRGNAYM